MIATSSAATPLVDAAFGAHPGAWPLLAAGTPTDLWLRAVAAGGQGRYAEARAALAELLRSGAPGPLASLALSTRGSFLRQLGWHELARGWDGQALARAGDNAEARLDAMVGLAADALGLGRLRLAATLLQRAGDTYRRAEGPAPRLGIRLQWVSAELAMAGGDGASAVGHARRGLELALDSAPQLCRHHVKSQVVLAAALCTAGDPMAARAAADAALPATEAQRLIPLRWALACLLGEVGSADHSPVEVAEIRQASARFIARHGGQLRSG